MEVYSPLVVCPQHLNLLSYLVLHESFELSELLKDLSLGLQEIDPGFLGIIINEGYAVTVTTERMDTHTSECTKSKGSLDLYPLCGKGFLMLFPKAQPLQWLCFSSCT